MKLFKLSLTLLCCASALYFAACGDDITEVSSQFETVESLKGLDCSKDNEGDMVFVKPTATMYVCSENEWNALVGSEESDYRCKSEVLKDSSGYKIICGEEVIGTVTNNVTEEDGKPGVVSEIITKDLVDSLKDVIASDLACKIEESRVDEDESKLLVTVACGENTSTLEMPVVTPSKNLTKVYNKTVVVRLPADLRVFDYSSVFNSEENMWINTQLSDIAEVTVMEVDSQFNPTGKNFISDIVQSFQDMEIFQKVTVNGKEIETRTPEKYTIARLGGNISVTNMMNSFAQVRVSLNLAPASLSEMASVSAYFGSTKVVFNALVNLDDSDTIVVDFLTDYKGARVKKLLENGKTFKNASQQANDELTSALGMAKLPMLEHYLRDSYGFDEYTFMTFIPTFFSNVSYAVPFNLLYDGFKNVFASNGNFKNPIQFDISKVLDGFGLPKAWYLADIYFFGKVEYFDYKFYQKLFVDAYNLPACNGSRYEDMFNILSKKEGIFKMFECLEGDVWKPYDEYYAIKRLQDVFETTIVMEKYSGKTCNESTVDSIASVQIGSLILQAKCDDNKWFILENNLECEESQKGQYFMTGIQSGSGLTIKYLRCTEKVMQSGKKYILENVSENEYYIGKPCTIESKDTLYTYEGTDNFYACDVGAGQYIFIDDEYTIIEKQIGDGTCSEEDDGKTKMVYFNKSYGLQYTCVEGEWLPSYLPRVLFGVCDEAKMNELKVYKYDDNELWQSDFTSNDYVKCNFTTKSYGYPEEFWWQRANELDVLLNIACTKANSGDTITSDGTKYVCISDNMYGHYWDVYNKDSYCDLNGTTAEQLDLNMTLPTNATIEGQCKFEDETYIKTYNSFVWIQGDDYCDSNVGQCSSTITNKHCVFAEYYTIQADYICDVEQEKWVLPKDEQEFCNAVYEKNQICDFKEKAYMYNETSKEWEEQEFF